MVNISKPFTEMLSAYSSHFCVMRETIWLIELVWMLKSLSGFNKIPLTFLDAVTRKSEIFATPETEESKSFKNGSVENRISKWKLVWWYLLFGRIVTCARQMIKAVRTIIVMGKFFNTVNAICHGKSVRVANLCLKGKKKQFMSKYLRPIEFREEGN